MLTDPAIQTSFEPLTHLKKGAREKDPQAIKQVAKQFESLFVKMMLKSMRDTVPENELFGSNAERMYQDLYDKQLSLQISNGRGIGLAEVIERQLGGVPENELSARKVDDYLSNPRSVVPVDTLLEARKNTGDIDKKIMSAGELAPENKKVPTNENIEPVLKKGAWESADDFINDVWPHALRASEKLGIDADVLLAQSALETGWGKHLPLNTDGSNSFNLFGIKADQRWQGDSVEIMTREFRHGVMQHEKSAFRSYDSVSQAFEDYTNFIKSSPRYQKALEHRADGDAYARELQKAGYATDPDYAKKIKRVRSNEDLQAKVIELKNINPAPLT